MYDTLKQLGVYDKPVITVFNKQDKVIQQETLRDFKADHTVKISAKTGEGLEELKSILEQVLKEKQILIERVYPYNEAGKIQQIRKFGQLLEEEYQADGIYVKAYVPTELYGSVC